MSVAGLLLVVSIVLLSRTGTGDYVTTHLGNAALFRVRAALDQEPALDPRLKLVVFDDPSADYVQGSELPFDRWIDLLGALQARAPARIIIDKVFVFPPRDEALLEKFRGLGRSPVPIGVGGYTHPYIEGKPLLPLDRPMHRLSTYLQKGEARPYAWLAPSLDRTYGPHKDLRDAFQIIGQLNYLPQRPARFQPFILFPDQSVFPHLSLTVANSVAMSETGALIDDRAIPIDGEGFTLINFVSHRRLLTKAFSIAGQLARLDRRLALNLIEPNDVILIIPGFATGNADNYDTPLGRMRGGMLLASMVNSVLTGAWLREYPTIPVAVSAAVLVGGFLAALPTLTLFIPLVFASMLAIVALAFTVFVMAGVMLPWVWMNLGLALMATLLFTILSVDREIKGKVLKQALATLVPPEKLNELMAAPDKVSLKPNEHVVTMLFFDLVGFSLSCEAKTPAQTFAELKSLMEGISDLVTAHGGMIDKVLGDGALCTFGYSILSGSSTSDHSEAALACACAIQKHVLQRNREIKGEAQSIYPVRIGIHAASVYLGDLGSRERIEFTVIGQGVNFAKRLEEACEPYQIMLSVPAVDFLGAAAREKFRNQLRRRDMNMKHHSELVAAYECDPFSEEPETLSLALRQYSRFAGRTREDERFVLPIDQKIPVQFDLGRGEICDYSGTGMRVETSFYVAKGVFLLVNFLADGGSEFFLRLRDARLAQIQTLVRWGRPLDGERYALGLEFISMNAEQQKEFVQILREQRVARKLVA